MRRSRSYRSKDGGILVNTDRAHRLAYRAWKKGGQSLQQTVLSNLFHALIVDHKDISNVEILSEIAKASCLMGKDEVRSLDSRSRLKRSLINRYVRPPPTSTRTKTYRRLKIKSRESARVVSAEFPSSLLKENGPLAAGRLGTCTSRLVTSALLSSAYR
jgi:hypothetical protein